MHFSENATLIFSTVNATCHQGHRHARGKATKGWFHPRRHKQGTFTYYIEVDSCTGLHYLKSAGSRTNTFLLVWCLFRGGQFYFISKEDLYQHQQMFCRKKPIKAENLDQLCPCIRMAPSTTSSKISVFVGTVMARVVSALFLGDLHLLRLHRLVSELIIQKKGKGWRRSRSCQLVYPTKSS